MTGKATPRMRIIQEAERIGREAFVTGCIKILEGTELDQHLISVLGGEPAQFVLSGSEGGIEGYWPRVWAARGLLHCFEPMAREAITRALHDSSWRVREMALKVILRHDVTESFDEVIPLFDDPNARVRLAAELVLKTRLP